MKALYVRKLFLWPRFQATVRATLEDEVPAPADVGLPPLCLLHCLTNILRGSRSVMDC